MTERRGRVRVFVPTYRRPALLERALISLQAQTRQDWVCEVHNDAPDDLAPAALVDRLADSRIRLVSHDRNLGAVETFNLFFQPTAEPFYTLLEDDNWWRPTFLEVMIAALEKHPDVSIAWCNQQIWRENEDGSWTDTQSQVNGAEDSTPRQVNWGHPRQALGALHANGAMLVRTCANERFSVSGLPFTGMEAARERLLPHPMLYVPEPLAIYSLTRQSARADDASEWFAFQTVMLATFVRHAHMGRQKVSDLWSHYRRNSPAPTNVFLTAALICRECRPLLKEATLADWLRFFRSALGHPISILGALRVRSRHPGWWEFLNRATAARFAEAGSSGQTDAHARPARQ